MYKKDRYLGKKSAFTLIELSIVLIIIGLIIGGVLGGQALIKNSQTRSVISDFNGFQTSFNTFKLKYNCVPGDCKNFNTFFSGAPSGNGNSVIEATIAEAYYVWRHLYLANMIQGNYTGASSSPQYNPGVNIPASRISGAGYGVDQSTGIYQNSTNIDALALSSNAGSVGSVFNGSAVTPDMAQQIDTKMDDGVPNTGIILGLRGAAVSSNTVCTDQGYGSVPTGSVNYLAGSDKTVSCRLWYIYN